MIDHELRCAVAYVKYERASCAAAAMEALHETVLADGRTRLKVLLAEAPTARRNAWIAHLQHQVAETIFACDLAHFHPDHAQLKCVFMPNALL